VFHDDDRGSHDPDERADLARLRKENTELRMNREILCEAAEDRCRQYRSSIALVM